MLKRVYLHIGAPKTGTSSLQVFCRDNWKWLLSEHGLYYPPEIGEGGDFFVKRPNRHHILLDNNSNDIIWRWLAEKVKEYPKTDALLLSSERISRANGFSRVPIRNIINKLSLYFPDIPCTIIYYIRRLDDYIKSYYNQVMKVFRRRHTDADPFIHNYAQFLECSNAYFPGFRLSRILHECIKVVGKDNVVCRIFDREKLKDNDLVSDFFDILQIDVSNVHRDVERNPGLPNSCIPFLNILYRDEQKMTQNIGKIQDKVLAAFNYQDTMVPDKVISKEIEGEVRRIDALMPGYGDLFTKREFSLNFPKAYMKPTDLLSHDTLFSIFKYCGTLDAQGQKNHEALSSQLQVLVGNEQKRLEDDHYKRLQSFIIKHQEQLFERVAEMLFPNLPQRIVLLAYGLLLFLSGRKDEYLALWNSPYKFINRRMEDIHRSSLLVRVLGFLGPLFNAGPKRIIEGG